MAIKITVWNEFVHEKNEERVREIHPNGIHETIASFLRPEEDFVVRTATLDMEECGLTQEVLDDTDVLLWWGHLAHGRVPDEVAKRVQKAVLGGMGLIALHSGHESKVFQLLTGTSCGLRWHEYGEKERIHVIAPRHPIMQGIPERFELEHEEMYAEHFDIPQPDELLAIGWWPSGEVFRSVFTLNRGGRVVYIQPGHETFRSYENKYVQQLIKNAVRWAARIPGSAYPYGSQFAEPLEDISAFI